MSEYVCVAKRSELSKDTGRSVAVKGRLIAIFLEKDEVYALDDACPHAGGPLSEGYVCDGVVTCPWHAWRFRVTDGVWADAPQAGTRATAYRCKVEGDNVLLEVDW